MIEIWNFRQKDGPETLISSRYAETDEAIISLCKYELGYGGVITSITEEHIEVKTQVFHCHDRTVFSGAKEDMESLQVAAYLWLKAEKEISMDAWYQKVSEVTKGVPLLVAMSAGILKGELVKEKLQEQLGSAG